MKNPFRHYWFCVGAALAGGAAATVLICGGAILLARNATAGWDHDPRDDLFTDAPPSVISLCDTDALPASVKNVSGFAGGN